MVPTHLANLVFERYVPKDDDEELILEFEGIIYTKPCKIYLTDKKLIRVCLRQGLPKRRWAPLEKLIIKEERKGSVYTCISLEYGDGYVKMLIYPSFAAVIKKKIASFR
jgi:hypothetical protein